MATVRAIQRAAEAKPGTQVVVTTDGGVQNSKHRHHHIGAWAAAVDGVSGTIECRSGPVQGIDQTAFAAELSGALVVLRAAVRARAAVHLVIDNRAVQRGVSARLDGAVPPPRYSFGTWSEVDVLAAALRQLPVRSECSWIPSHGTKMDEWRPPDGLSGARLRTINDAADEAASSLAERRWTQERQSENQAEATARTWALQVLYRLQRAERQYLDKWLPDWRHLAA